MINTISKTVLLIASIALLAACVGGPVEKRPEVVEQAYKSLGAGVSNYNDSKYSLAQSHFNNALRIFRSIDHQEGAASSCLNIAKVFLERGEVKSAQEYLTIAESIITSSALNNLTDHLAISKSSLAIANGDYSNAKQILKPLTNIKQDNSIKLAAIQNRIRIAIAETDLGTARSLTTSFEKSLDTAGQANTSYQARLFRFQAALSSDSTSADENLGRALTIYRQHTHRPGIASTLHEWGDIHLKNNKATAASEILLRALYIRQSIEDKAGSIRLLESLNKAYVALGLTDMSKRTELWVNRVSAADFNHWDKFTEAFNSYPSY